MGNLLNKIVDNNALFIGVVVGLCIILVILIILIVRSFKNNKKINIYEEELEDEDIKKVKNVKKEDIIESPTTRKKKEKVESIKVEDDYEEEVNDNTDYIDDLESELKEKYSDEYQKEIEEVKEETTNSKLASIISKMEEDSKLKPEDVVANFEKEQEAQSIISYKELVNAVKNRQEDYEDELESKPLKTVSDLMEELENSQMEEAQKEEEKEEKVEEPKIEETKTKFRNTDVISPVYGRVEQPSPKDDLSSTATIDLSNIELSDMDFMPKKKPNVNNDELAMSELDKIYSKMADDLKKNEGLEDSKEVEKLTRNEEFLQSLKDFRNKL